MKFNLNFTKNSLELDLKFERESHEFDLSFGETQKVTEYIGGEQYTGDYVVTPKVTEQTIPTKDKVLIEDMKVKSIPFFNVSNTSGGSTVYIGNEV